MRAPADEARSNYISLPFQTYRVCWFDNVQRVPAAELIEARDDNHALSLAEAAARGADCEVWHGRRLVAQLRAERQAS